MGLVSFTHVVIESEVMMMLFGKLRFLHSLWDGSVSEDSMAVSHASSSRRKPSVASIASTNTNSIPSSSIRTHFCLHLGIPQDTSGEELPFRSYRNDTIDFMYMNYRRMYLVQAHFFFPP